MIKDGNKRKEAAVQVIEHLIIALLHLIFLAAVHRKIRIDKQAQSVV